MHFAQPRTTPAKTSRSLRPALVLFLAFTFATLLFTFVSFIVVALGHETFSIRWTFIWHASKFYIWTAFSPLVIALARTRPIDRTNWLGRVTFHFVAALLCSLVVTSLSVVAVVLWQRNSFSSVPEAVENGSIPFSWGLLIYWSILLGTNALDNYTHYRAEQLRSSRLEVELAQAQLEALRMQLQPHFLFNTLHSLSDLVLEDAEAAVRMIAKLGDFLRLTLEGRSEQVIALREELQFVLSYLEIEQIRFHDRLKVSVSVEQQAYSAQVPNLILQPIVENAIRHGIAARSGAGRIAIVATQHKGRLQITVEDDGPGPLGFSRFAGKGLGLENTEARLKCLYGEGQSLELTPAPTGGTIVKLSIPFNTLTSALLAEINSNEDNA